MPVLFKKKKKAKNTTRPNSNKKKIVPVETEVTLKPLTHIYMTVHFFSFVQEHQ